MNVIITGATGMIGKAVLIECLESDQVDAVLIVNRSPSEIEHPKLKEIIHKDFSTFDAIRDQFEDYDACFFCLGVSSIGMDEKKYHQITYQITESFVETLFQANPKMVVNYVSGTGTDSTENGSVMWARVKGKTENMVLNKGFKDAYAIRIGAVFPVKGVRSKTGWVNTVYFMVKPIYPIIKNIASIIESSAVGLAMINSVLHPQEKKKLENDDLLKLANL